MTTPNPAPPHRGGTHYSYGVYLGGSALTITYTLAGPSSLNFRSINQTRAIRVVTAIEGALNKRRDEITSLKFNGKLDTNISATLTELNKTSFEFELSRLIANHGLQTFFYVPSSGTPDMIFLPDHAHKITVQNVIDEHNSRMLEPSAVNEVDSSGNPTNVETVSSKLNRFKCYDQYELTDITLSRLLVDCLISSGLRLQVMTRFRHDTEFENYPGSVYLMMILEVVNASTSLDITQAIASFTVLALVDYPGENISTFVDEALRLIHIMDCAYALPYQLGSQLLEKLDSTSSNYFNMQVQQMLFEARKMEDSVGPVSDPKSLTAHTSYQEFGPIGLCSALQTLYAGLLKSNSWPALASSIPESNNAPSYSVVDNAVNSSARNNGNDDSNGNNRNDANPNNNGGSNGNPNNPTRSPIMLSSKVWKYLKPADLDQCIEVNGSTYYWCGKCVCRNTSKVGLYNLTHSTSQHRRSPAASSTRTTDNTTNSANLSSVPTLTNETDSPSSPSNSSVVKDKSVKFADPVNQDVKDDEVIDPDPDGFQFHGAFMHADSPEGAWICAIDDDEDDDLEEVPPPSFVDSSVILEETLSLEGAWVCAIDDDDDDADLFGPPLPPSFQPTDVPMPNAAIPSSSNVANVSDSDPFATAAIRLALSGVSNEMNHEGFAVDTLLPIESTIDRPASNEPTSNSSSFGPDLPPAQVPFPSLTSTDPVDSMRAAIIALSQVAEPRNETWPDNVVSALPGMTLYSVNEAPHLVFQDIHPPAHCEYCGRLGDWLTLCRCGKDAHVMSDDDDYSQGRLNIHWDSDVDTAEFLETDNETDDDSDSNTEEGDDVVSLTENNYSTTPYFQPVHLSHFFAWYFLCSLSSTCYYIFTSPTLALKTFITSLWCFLSPWVLIFAAIFWDTLYLYLDPTAPQGPHQPRHIRRAITKLKHPPLRSYSRHWLLLSYFMLSVGLRLSPFAASFSAFTQTLTRLSTLHDLVDFTPMAHLHFSSYCFDEIKSLTTSFALEETIPFDTSSTPSAYPEHFFLPSTTLSEMRGDLDNLDFFDCLEPTWTDSIFDFGDLQNPHFHILSHHHQLEPDPDDLIEQLMTPHAYAALSAPTLGNVDLYPIHNMPSSFPVILDSGASLAISPSEEDFVGPITYYTSERSLGGMAGGMAIKGIGKIAWSYKTPTGILTIHSKCYYVPTASARLLSPQRLFSHANHLNGRFICEELTASLVFDDVGTLTVSYDENNHLPIAMAKNLTGTQSQINLAVLDESNQNLTASQKLLVLWHSKFGHKGFTTIQRLFKLSPFNSERFKAASQCDIPKCEVCEHAKAHRQKTHGAKQSTNKVTDGALKVNDLIPGSSVSVDHFESRLKGRRQDSYGKSPNPYVGGCIFVDHMSGYIHVEEQLGFSGTETIRAKQSFEKLALDHGVVIHNYLCDNGIFKRRAFVKHLHEHNQKVQYCGVNAHHQNGVAERSIRTVSDCARALLLHAALRWKDGPINSSFWPFAVQHACYLYNHCPDASGTCPADRFYGEEIPRHKLLDLHCWGCPVYVLDPVLQQGRKLPKWQPRSRRGVFLGFSRFHSSDVPLVLNLKTGYISPQYHIVFDDTFSSVVSHSVDEEPPEFWNSIELDAFTYKIPVDNPPPYLQDDWLTPTELEEKQRYQLRNKAIRGTYHNKQHPLSPGTITSSTQNNISKESSIKEPTTPPLSLPSLPSTNLEEATPSTISTNLPLPTTPSSAPTSPPSNQQPSPSVPDPSPSIRRSTRINPPMRRSDRQNRGVRDTLFMDEAKFHLHQAFLANVIDPSRTDQEATLAYMADLSTDFNTGDTNCSDPRAFAAKHKLNDPDMPSYTNAVTGEHAIEYIAAMKNEIKQLIKQKTWSPLYRKNVPPSKNGQRRPILKGTWVFKLKRYPDGSPMKFKARYCVRGDLQREGIDYFETYAPVIQWSTVRLVLTLILANHWITKQVDYTNAFAQAALKEEVYIESPRGFNRKDGKDVLKLNNSLYGLKQAPKTFYEKLRDGLLERGFTQSMLDPCLFMKRDMICLIYVDDTIITGPDTKAIEDLITSLGVTSDEQIHTFELRDEGEVGAFLGIQIERNKNDTFYLTQTGLIKKVLATAGMENSKATVKTPASTIPLGLDVDGDPFIESWEYPVIIGMLLYLSQNSRPDIAYAVHQCARFTHSPKHSHAVAVKRILRYLNSTKDKGMTLKPTKSLAIDCYVDADFAGLWNVEDEQNPLSVKSRTGFLITFMGCPLHWVSKLQSQIALSTMESEYIALSQAMREIIGFRETLKEIYTLVLADTKTYQSLSFHAISKTFGVIPQSTVHEDNEACLRFATVPKMSP